MVDVIDSSAMVRFGITEKKFPYWILLLAIPLLIPLIKKKI